MISSTDPHPDIDAVFFDVGGVILSSPFEAFAAYEDRMGLPRDAIRTINSTDPDTNAWARFERSELNPEQFVVAFESEARTFGWNVDGHDVLRCLDGAPRPAMVQAVARIHERFATALLTNNVVGMAASLSGAAPSGAHQSGGETVGPLRDVLAHIDVIVESSVVGVRKPDPAFYEIACERVGVSPDRVVFLDDLGINLKPARAMGMTTIKVIDPRAALTELSSLLGLELAS